MVVGQFISVTMGQEMRKGAFMGGKDYKNYLVGYVGGRCDKMV